MPVCHVYKEDAQFHVVFIIFLFKSIPSWRCGILVDKDVFYMHTGDFSSGANFLRLRNIVKRVLKDYSYLSVIFLVCGKTDFKTHL